MRCVRPASALSVLLAGAVCALWARSIPMAETLSLPKVIGRDWCLNVYVTSWAGNLGLTVRCFSFPETVRDRFGVSGGGCGWSSERYSDRAHYSMHRNNFQYARRFVWHVDDHGGLQKDGVRGKTIRAVVPHGAVLVALLLLPLTYAGNRLRRVCMGSEPLRCARCAYDLRGTPHRCPECGTVPKPPPAEGLPASRWLNSSASPPVPPTG